MLVLDVHLQNVKKTHPLWIDVLLITLTGRQYFFRDSQLGRLLQGTSGHKLLSL
jgi:hypothetical protein